MYDFDQRRPGLKRNELEERLNSAKFPSFKNMLNDVTEGDTIEEMKKIPDNTVDMVLVDLPYGTTQNKWDSVIPLDELWKQYHRIVKKNGAMIFTASGLFTADQL